MIAKVFRCFALGVLLFVALPSARADAPVTAGKFSILLADTQKEIRRLQEVLEEVRMDFRKKSLVWEKLDRVREELQDAQRYMTPEKK